MSNTAYRLIKIMRREVLRIATKPMYLFCMIIAPILCYVFFATLMSNGLPTDMPAGVVDLDNTSTTRNIIRNLDAFQQTKIVAHYSSVAEARKAVQRGEGSLIYRDMRTMSELAGGAVGRETLYAKGATEDQAMGFLQPIVIDTHAINNPWLNYSIYLCNTLFPGVLMLLIFMTTAYTLGTEIKENTGKELMALADNSIVMALIGKILPQTLIFFIMATFHNIYLYGFLHFPCHGGIFSMIMAGLLLVLASQSVGIFFYGLFGSMRLALSAASLWGVLSFSISGFTFPVMAMHPTLQALSNLFPLRHYFLLYVNQALNGYPIIYAWHSVVALMLFLLLPFFVLKKLRQIMETYVYLP